MAAWLAAVPAAISAVGSLFGGLFGGGDDEQRRIIERQRRENQNWYDRRYNEDATQRSDTLHILQQTEDAIRKRNKAAQGAEAVMGGPTERTAQQKEAGNELMQKVVGNVVAQNDKRKDMIENQYQRNKNMIENQQLALEEQKAANKAEGLKGLFNAGAEIASTLIPK